MLGWLVWVDMANVCSLAIVVAHEPDDSSCCCGFGVHIWDAQAYGKQYVYFTYLHTTTISEPC